MPKPLILILAWLATAGLGFVGAFLIGLMPNYPAFGCGLIIGCCMGLVLAAFLGAAHREPDHE